MRALPILAQQVGRRSASSSHKLQGLLRRSASTSSKSFQGVWPIVATPFHDDEALDLEGFAKSIRFFGSAAHRAQQCAACSASRTGSRTRNEQNSWRRPSARRARCQSASACLTRAREPPWIWRRWPKTWARIRSWSRPPKRRSRSRTRSCSTTLPPCRTAARCQSCCRTIPHVRACSCPPNCSCRYARTSPRYSASSSRPCRRRPRSRRCARRGRRSRRPSLNALF